MKTRVTFLILAAGMIVGVLLGAAAMLAENRAPVEWRDSRLSIHFNDAPISTILSAIAGATGIQLSVDPAVASFRESVSFQAAPLRDAILKVLDGSEIDYIIVGDSLASEAVKKVMLLGFSPKGPSTEVSMGAMQNQRVNPYATSQPPNMFSGQAGMERPAARPGIPGRFLPFPEAGQNQEQVPSSTATETNPQAGRPVPPNPFNPNPTATPNIINPTPVTPGKFPRGPGLFPQDKQ